MNTQTHFHSGDQHRVDYVAAADVVQGEVVRMSADSAVFGICTSPEGIEQDALGSLDLGGKGGIYRFAKDETSGPVFAVGDLIGWDLGDKLAVVASDAAADGVIGVCTKAAGASDDYVEGVFIGWLGASHKEATLNAIVALTDSTTGTVNNTLAAIPVPTDTPASADALRDDIAANIIPVLRDNFADLAAKVNAILAALKG